MTNENDMIRRGDALQCVHIWESLWNRTEDAIAALPADPRVAELEAVKAAVWEEAANVLTSQADALSPATGTDRYYDQGKIDGLRQGAAALRARKDKP
jgi:hypothetical protein